MMNIYIYICDYILIYINIYIYVSPCVYIYVCVRERESVCVCLTMCFKLNTMGWHFWVLLTWIVTNLPAISHGCPKKLAQAKTDAAITADWRLRKARPSWSFQHTTFSQDIFHSSVVISVFGIHDFFSFSTTFSTSFQEISSCILPKAPSCILRHRRAHRRPKGTPHSTLHVSGLTMNSRRWSPRTPGSEPLQHLRNYSYNRFRKYVYIYSYIYIISP